jgi:hypothetical protein
MYYFGAILVPLILGAVGWVALEFVGRPVRTFFDLRSRAKTVLLLYTDPFDEDEDNPKGEFKDLGAKLVAFDGSEMLAGWFTRLLGFNVRGAGYALMNLSNDWGKQNVAYKEYRKQIKSGLKLRDRAISENW